MSVSADDSGPSLQRVQPLHRFRVARIDRQPVQRVGGIRDDEPVTNHLGRFADDREIGERASTRNVSGMFHDYRRRRTRRPTLITTIEDH